MDGIRKALEGLLEISLKFFNLFSNEKKNEDRASATESTNMIETNSSFVWMHIKELDLIDHLCTRVASRWEINYLMINSFGNN